LEIKTGFFYLLTTLIIHHSSIPGFKRPLPFPEILPIVAFFFFSFFFRTDSRDSADYLSILLGISMSIFIFSFFPLFIFFGFV